MRCPGCYKARVLHLKEAGDKPSTTDSTSRGMRLDVSRLGLGFAHGRSKLQGMRVDRFTQHQFLCVESLYIVQRLQLALWALPRHIGCASAADWLLRGGYEA